MEKELEKKKGNKLKPCPFCGGCAELIEFETGICFIWCMRCHASTSHYTEKEALDSWNNRAGVFCDE